MKKLESIRESKFELSEIEMNQIKGGTHTSYKSTTTILGGGQATTDMTAYDKCEDVEPYPMK